MRQQLVESLLESLPNKMESVQTKPQFVKLYKAGLTGNSAPTWSCLEEFTKARYTGLAHIRSRIPSAPTYYNIEAAEVKRKWNQLMNSGCSPHQFYISGMAPHHHNLIQGEVLQTEQYLTMRYSRVTGLPMREGLARSEEHATGIIALRLLQHYLCPNSYEWLLHLFSAYPLHVIEFSTFAVNWGTLPNHNTVFWEVRRY